MRKEVIGDATLYLADCLEVLPTLDGVDAVVTDPPYGISWDTDIERFSGGAPTVRSQRRRWATGIVGDGEAFDPSPWVGFPECILWGANNYMLPAGTGLVWVKRNPASFGTFLSDAELGWMKGGHGVYCHYDVSRNGAGQNFIAHHPHEKPIGLMMWCLQKTRGEIVLDPFMGSGTTGVACVHLGRKFIGIEIDETYFDIACERIAAAERQVDMFIEKPEQGAMPL